MKRNEIKTEPESPFLKKLLHAGCLFIHVDATGRCRIQLTVQQEQKRRGKTQ